MSAPIIAVSAAALVSGVPPRTPVNTHTSAAFTTNPLAWIGTTTTRSKAIVSAV